VPTLPSGSGLIASRAAVGYVVTEFGSVNLLAKSFKERALALIEIAHPKFRQEFLNRAKDEGLLSGGEPITFLTQTIYPQELEKKVTVDGRTLVLRPAKPTDVRIIQEFFYGLSDRDVYYRFLRSMKAFPKEEMAAMADIDFHFRMTVLCLTGEVGFEKIVSIARYISEPGKNLVEVDVAVASGYRRLGIAKTMLETIIDIAKNNGFKGMTAYVDADNPKTILLLKKLGYNMRAVLDHGVYEIEILFDEKVDEPSFVVTYA
jgi:GNAT superfamily N-acetyltransferase